MFTSRRIKELVIFSIIIISYNVLVFVIPFNKDACFYWSYIFAMIAIFGFATCWFYAFDKDTTLRNRFLGFPIFKIGIIYLGLQLLYSTGSMIKTTFYPMPAWIVVVPSMILLAVAITKVLTIDIVRDKLRSISHKQQVDTTFIRMLQIDIDALSERITDEKIKKQVSSLYEKVKFSDPVSNHHLIEIETLIKSKFEEMKSMVYGGNMEIAGNIEKITLLLSERNKKCKMSKLDMNIFGSVMM